MHKISPLKPILQEILPTISNVAFATASAQMTNISSRYSNRDNLVMMVFDGKTSVAGVYSQASIVSCTIDWDKECLTKEINQDKKVIIINAGNANSVTGEAGWKSIDNITSYISKEYGIPKHNIFLSSTGVIGVPLQDDKIIEKIPSMYLEMFAKDTKQNWKDIAKSIMTTDTFPKLASRKFQLNNKEIIINAVTKGSGMIAPNMATMLAYFVTNAGIEQQKLQEILSRAVVKSFNSITVDSDCSTNDTAMIFATHEDGCDLDTHEELEKFEYELQELAIEMAKMIVCDGEGASKLVEITIENACSDVDARIIGLSVANSPLVKTAIAGSDANWGRIIMAIGKAGVKDLDVNKISLYIGGNCLLKNGNPKKDLNEENVNKYMKGSSIDILIDLGYEEYNGSGKVWTCDLTHDYIDINASYRT